mmetsp:Transcript_40956/g.96547  ORF Transcript_40956/g.96547 Transcript_40956/m.96547 type:complete len:276 (+) Transcript_40956:357-1184(+)
MRMVRHLGMSAVTPRRDGLMLARLGGDPAAMTASPMSSSSPTEIAFPFMNAPWPRAAEKTSSRKGSTITPTTSSPRRATPMLTADRGIPETKLVVPSIGSTTQSHSESFTKSMALPEASAPAATLSSPRNECAGCSASTMSRMIFSHMGSISVSKSLLFTLVLITSAPSFSFISAPAARPALIAVLSTALSSASVADIRAPLDLRRSWDPPGTACFPESEDPRIGEVLRGQVKRCAASGLAAAMRWATLAGQTNAASGEACTRPRSARSMIERML